MEIAFDPPMRNVCEVWQTERSTVGGLQPLVAAGCPQGDITQWQLPPTCPTPEASSLGLSNTPAPQAPDSPPFLADTSPAKRPKACILSISAAARARKMR